MQNQWCRHPPRLSRSPITSTRFACGAHSQRKALIEALVAQVKITGPGRVVPVFRIPQATCTEHSVTSGKVSGVRAVTNLVGPMHVI
jgi:hypothetical protein